MVKQACDALLLVLLPYLSAPPCTSAIGAAGWASLFRDSIDSLDLTLDSTHSTDMQSKDVNEAIQTQQPSKPARNSQSTPPSHSINTALLYSPPPQAEMFWDYYGGWNPWVGRAEKSSKVRSYPFCSAAPFCSVCIQNIKISKSLCHHPKSYHSFLQLRSQSTNRPSASSSLPRTSSTRSVSLFAVGN